VVALSGKAFPLEGIKTKILEIQEFFEQQWSEVGLLVEFIDVDLGN
jgi:hypothetical protein